MRRSCVKNQRTPPGVGDQLVFTNPLQRARNVRLEEREGRVADDDHADSLTLLTAAARAECRRAD